MSVSERVMAMGDWSVKLRRDTPPSVRAELDFYTYGFGHIVIMASGLDDADALPDAAVLAGARYVGVCTQQTGPDFELSGHGLSWWLGDPDGQGCMLSAALTLTNTAFDAGVASLLAGTGTVAVGSVQSVAGNYTRTFQYTTVRQALDDLCAVYYREWVVRPDFTVDAGTPAYLYGSAAQALAVRKGGARDLDTPGITADMSTVVDLSQHYSALLLSAPSGTGAYGGANSFGWRDGRGNLVQRSAMFEMADWIPAGWESAAATGILAKYNVRQARREMTLDTDDYDVRGTVEPGAYIACYDPDLGIQDMSDPDDYQGEEIWPQLVRVTGMTWPVEPGMGVYYRRTTGASTFSYVDLSPWVEWESPGAQFEITAGGSTDIRNLIGGTSRA